MVVLQLRMDQYVRLQENGEEMIYLCPVCFDTYEGAYKDHAKYCRGKNDENN